MIKKAAKGMVVWVVEAGCYSGKGLGGIYASLEDAKAAHKAAEWKVVEWDWEGQHWVQWTNGLDWEEYVSIMQATIQ